MSGPKSFDVIVYGATGYTGALVAQYMATDGDSALGSPTALKWAIAGRSATKLAQLKATLKKKLPNISPELIDEIPVVVADSSDEQALVAMVRQTKVVLTVVGPFKLYGSLLVKVCAENGVHYCDLTGEAAWVREMVGTYQKAAEATGAVLVNFCGYECIPSDMTTFLVADKMREQHDTDNLRVDLFFTGYRGGSSGGTNASMFTAMETSTMKQISELSNPFYLTSSEYIASKRAADNFKPNEASLAVKYDKSVRRWSSFSSLVLGGLANQAVVHRSNYLMGDHYGSGFIYRERLAHGGLLKQIAATVGYISTVVMLFLPFTRWILKKTAPSPGEGPSDEALKNGFFSVEAVGYADDKAVVTAAVVGAGHPGYLLASHFMVESAFCLAKCELRGPTVTGGFHTTASAFGHKLADRLKRKQILSIDIQETK
jgi:short subunit dehydrogenase-like uncharacterized protein